MYLSNVKSQGKLMRIWLGKLNILIAFSNAVRNQSINGHRRPKSGEAPFGIGCTDWVKSRGRAGQTIVVGDGQDVQRRLAIFSAYLSPKNDAVWG